MNVTLQRIKCGVAKTVALGIPESRSTDTVTYRVYRASDKSVFSSGAAEFISGNEWSLSFTPTIVDTYIVEVTDATLDVTYSRPFVAVSTSAEEDGVLELNAAVDIPIGIAGSEATDRVVYEIYRVSDKVLVASGLAEFISGISWKLTFTPTSADTYVVEVYDQTIDVKYSLSFKSVIPGSPVEKISQAPAAPTDEEMLAQINKAIYARTTGGAVQAYSVSGINIQYATLDELWKMRDRLVDTITSKKGYGRSYVRFEK